MQCVGCRSKYSNTSNRSTARMVGRTGDTVGDVNKLVDSAKSSSCRRRSSRTNLHGKQSGLRGCQILERAQHHYINTTTCSPTCILRLSRGGHDNRAIRCVFNTTTGRLETSQPTVPSCDNVDLSNNTRIGTKADVSLYLIF